VPVTVPFAAITSAQSESGRAGGKGAPVAEELEYAVPTSNAFDPPGGGPQLSRPGSDRRGWPNSPRPAPEEVRRLGRGSPEAVPSSGFPQSWT